MHSHEAVGAAFDSQKFQLARDKALGLLRLCASKAEAGMTEEDLKEVLLTLSSQFQVEKWWHPTKIRFGQNTQCSFRDQSLEGVTLKEGDLFFLDIGPVIAGHEADVGQTFRLGDGSFQNPAEIVFKKCQQDWQRTKLSGEALYQKAQSYAGELNLTLNPKMAGHRLSDFPHALHHRGALAAHEETPNAERWVLEIHLLENLEKGYFFEDLL